MQRIKCKFADIVLVPYEGLPSEQECETTDGVEVRIKPIAVWNNQNGRYNEELNDVCLMNWNLPFNAIRSVWFGRLGGLGDYWHLIKLVKV